MGKCANLKAGDGAQRLGEASGKVADGGREVGLEGGFHQQRLSRFIIIVTGLCFPLGLHANPSIPGQSWGD